MRLFDARDNVFAAMGRGAAAGVVGTAAMTLSSTLEAKLRNRGASSAPADAAGKVLGVEPKNPEGEQRFSNVAHWGYGTGWGVARGLLGRTGLSPGPATAAHLALVWGTAAVMLPALDVAPPAWRWGGEEVAIDLVHHSVYAGATGLAYEALP